MVGGVINNASGVIEQGGTRFPGWMNNIAIVNATTTNANDSIKITSADGTALSPSNYGWVTLPSVTAGHLTALSITADVTINLTGAHWGFGGNGDLVDQLLNVFALNNNGALVWGVARSRNRVLVLNADDSATATDITSVEKVLVNSALSADAQALKIGQFKASFDDAGGAAADLWAVQTGDGDISTGFLELAGRPNIYFAEIANNGTATITRQGGTNERSQNAIASVSRSAAGTVDITYTTDFFQVIPGVAGASLLDSGDSENFAYTSLAATGVTIFTEDVAAAAAVDTDFTMAILRMGDDYLKEMV